MTRVVVRYWAGAKAAAGRAGEEVEADTIGAALRTVRERRSDGALDSVLAVSSVLLDGRVLSASELDAPCEAGPVTVEILPPFAGGA